ncbi:inovirus-type Gp2 protein [Aquitalea sp. ASV11]|uniref:inovirus-type Gp2 protein n=1 Tax=Aquitalea sp. ASV11 TaxID=2795103 RepID=UPI0018ED0F8A|nr:inovirus-type Gp2 protein [Aquitalea sp. ASV11]
MVVGDLQNAVSTVISGMKLAVDLLGTDALPYRWVREEAGWDVFDSTDLVERLTFLKSDPFCKMWQYLSAYEVHPYLELLSNLINDVNGSMIAPWPCAMNAAHPSSQDPELARAWNRLVLAFREAVTQKDFEKIRQRMVRTANKNARGCKDYINALQKISKDLYVQRLELSYTPETRCTPGSIKKDLETLLRSRNQRRFEKSWNGLAGYVWKLEKGDLNWKVHLVLFFDGQIVTTARQAGWIATFWMRGWGKAERIAYLLQAKPDNYQLCAIGLMKRGVAEADQQLRMLVHYMTKLDEVMRLNIPGDPRFVTYSRGQLPRKKSKPSAKKKQEPAVVKPATYHPMPVYMNNDRRNASDPWRALFPRLRTLRREKQDVVVCDSSALELDVTSGSDDPSEALTSQEMGQPLPVPPQVSAVPNKTAELMVNGQRVEMKKRRPTVSVPKDV